MEKKKENAIWTLWKYSVSPRLNNEKSQENFKDLDWGTFSFSTFDYIKIEAQKCLV